ncbi:MAG TPA: hypothetical protein VMV94_16930, partial [Phycisphaerae bacterium]|nr:hypothetical protein [Phycisphaerae bacterium]
ANDREPTLDQDYPCAPQAAHPAANTLELRHVTDVLVQRSRIGWRFAISLTLSVLIIVAGIVVSLAVAGSGLVVPSILAILVVGIMMLILVFLAGKRWEKQIRRISSEAHDRDLGSLVREAAEHYFLAAGPYEVAKTIAVELARCGRQGVAIRIQSEEPFEQVQPLSVAFEPRLLDEADPAFDELSTALSSAQEKHGAAWKPSSGTDDILGVRRIKRNMILKGSWVLVLLPAIFLIRAAFEGYQRGALTPNLLFWGLMVLLTLYGPARGGWFGTKQWLVAPASVIIRKARSCDVTSQVRLFQRCESVLCMQRRKEGPWHVVIADSEGSEQTIATDREVVLLLRAWLSPLEPPPVERLSDLR